MSEFIKCISALLEVLLWCNTGTVLGPLLFILMCNTVFVNCIDSYEDCSCFVMQRKEFLQLFCYAFALTRIKIDYKKFVLDFNYILPDFCLFPFL